MFVCICASIGVQTIKDLEAGDALSITTEVLSGHAFSSLFSIDHNLIFL